MTRIKIFQTPKFVVSKPRVHCHVQVHIEFSEPIDDFEVVGTAFCHPEDTFDIEVGKKIAESRASTAVYEYLLNKLGDKFDSYAESMEQLCLGADRVSHLLDKEEDHLKTLINNTK